MTTVKKAVVANYSSETIANIVSDYQAGRKNGRANADILNDLSKKHGKTIPSIRAKLASLKVYVKDTDTSDKAPTKATKSDFVAALETLTGLTLASFEAVNKVELAALAEYLDDLLATIHDLKARI